MHDQSHSRRVFAEIIFPGSAGARIPQAFAGRKQIHFVRFAVFMFYFSNPAEQIAIRKGYLGILSHLFAQAKVGPGG